MSLRMGWIGLCVAYAVCTLSPPAAAQDTVSELTEDNVRAFIARTTEVTGRQDAAMSPEDILAYLEDHLDPEGAFKSRLTYNVPGYPMQENDMSLTKDQFIQSVLEGAQTLSDYKTNVTVGDVKISRDARNATVETRSRESGVMTLQSETGGQESIPVEGVSACTQILKLSPEGVIRMFNANCTTEITFQQPF